MPTRTTLADIAKEAGVSKTTVWLTVKNSPKIPPSTRERIHAIAEKMGYRPDPVLSHIAKARWKGTTRKPEAIAWIEEPSEWKGNSTQYFTQAKQQAKAQGYTIKRFELPYQESPANLGERLWSEGFRAVLVHHLFRASWKTEFPWDRFAAVSIQPNRYSRFLHSAKSNPRSGCAAAFKALLDHGYGRIGVILQHSKLNPVEPTRMGALLHLKRLLKDALPKIAILDLTDKAGHAKEVKSWMQKQKPEVVLGMSPSVIHLVSEIGYTIPADVAFASLSRNPAVDRRIAGVDIKQDLLLKRAICLLDSLIRSNEFGIPEDPYDLVIHQKWSDGDTLPTIGESLLTENSDPAWREIRDQLDEML